MNSPTENLPTKLDTATREQMIESLRQGRSLWDAGASAEAAAVFRRVLDLYPESAIAHAYLAASYRQQKLRGKSLQHEISYLTAPQLGNLSNEVRPLLQTIQQFTLLSQPRLISLYTLARQVCLEDVPGDFVECGTFRGGSAALLAWVIKHYSSRPRKLYCFDTFAGMPESSELDRHRGQQADDTPYGEGKLRPEGTRDLSHVCSKLGVAEHVMAVPGLFSETLPAYESKLTAIAFLHADADWFDSTMQVFDAFYHRLEEHGVVQVDDYGFWEGCAHAVHEFEKRQEAVFPLQWIDQTAVWFRKESAALSEFCIWRKLWDTAEAGFAIDDPKIAQPATDALRHMMPNLVYPRSQGSPANPPQEHDYVAPEMEKVQLQRYFPNRTIGDKFQCRWPYLRSAIPHHWYVDRRAPTIGFLNPDESHILYNTALRFRGQRGLAIGCWLGWSPCHIACAGVQLDVIDPILKQPDIRDSVVDALTNANVMANVRLCANASPQQIHDLATENGGNWSFFFTDGNQDAPGPLEDARACAEHAADDALFLFHDLASPEVARALDYLRDQGWKTMVYQTMQIMGVAWRGRITPIRHTPDPSVDWPVPNHLRHSHEICGFTRFVQ